MSVPAPSSLIPVLAVDDDAAQRHVLNATLHGVARVEFCATPEQALAALRTMRFEVAILDVHLRRSREDGFDVARALQAIDPTLEVLLYTGDDSAEVLENALEVRALRRILKASPRAMIVQAVCECAEATRRNRAVQRAAAIGENAQLYLEEQMRTIELSRTIADLYRGFFHSLANELTAIGVTGAVVSSLVERATAAGPESSTWKRIVEDLSATAGANTAALARVSTLVRQMTTDAGDLTNEAQRAQVGVALQAVAKTFLSDPRINGGIRVLVPTTELVLPISPAALVNVLRQTLNFLLARITSSANVTLAAELMERAEAEKVFAAERQLLALNREAFGAAARYVRFHCRCDTANMSVAWFASAFDGPPNAGPLYALAHVSARFSAPVACRQSSGGASFELFFPAWA